MIGKVKWFNSRHGYGIICSEMGEEFFASYREIQNNGFQNLSGGASVSFEKKYNPRGGMPFAVKIVLLDEKQ